MGDAATQPVKVLREHATSLEASLVVCLGSPKPKAVHKLRIETRRVEAQLLLLERMRGLPPFGKEAARVRKHLKKLRRAAGRVRDLDAQRDLLKREATKPGAHDHANAMVKLRKQRREQAADDLLKQIEKRQTKLAHALEKLLNALDAVADLQLPAAELLAIVEKQFRKSRELRLQEPATDDLHALRKTAKVARYLAEGASGSRRAMQAARRYESLQKAGGNWHDWLELAAEAKEELGRHHGLVDRFSRKRDRYLGQFHALLRPFRVR